MSTSGKIAFSINLSSEGFPPYVEGPGWATFVVNEDLTLSASRAGLFGSEFAMVRDTDNDQVLVLKDYMPDPGGGNDIEIYKGVDGSGQLLWEELDELGKVADALGVAKDSIRIEKVAPDNIAGRRYYWDIRENNMDGAPINVIVSCAVTASGFVDWRTVSFPENPVTMNATVYGVQFCNGVMFYYAVINDPDATVGQLYAKDMTTGVVTNYGDVVFSVIPGFPYRTGPIVIADASGNARYVCFFSGAYMTDRPLEYYDLQAGGPVNTQPSGYAPNYYDMRYYVQSGGVLYAATQFDYLLEAVTNIYDPPAAWRGSGRIGDDTVYGSINGAADWLHPTNISFGGVQPVSCFWTDRVRVEEDC